MNGVVNGGTVDNGIVPAIVIAAVKAKNEVVEVVEEVVVVCVTAMKAAATSVVVTNVTDATANYATGDAMRGRSSNTNYSTCCTGRETSAHNYYCENDHENSPRYDVVTCWDTYTTRSQTSS